MSKLILICLLCSVVCSSFLTEKHDAGPLIINGKQAEKGQFPWQAALLFEENSFCGGALISVDWILTAAHCLVGQKNSTIKLGSIEWDGSDPDRVVLTSDQFILHEKYNSTPGSTDPGYDIALIKLPQPVKLTDYIKTIDLAESQIDVGTTITVSGWGFTNSSNPGPSKYLNYLPLKTISTALCQQKFNTTQEPHGVFCAEHTSDVVQSPCQGDSGSPAVIYDDNNKVIHVGITDFVFDNRHCEIDKPSGFSSTYVYRQWIKEKSGV